MKEDPLERIAREEAERRNNGGLKTVMYILIAVAVALAAAVSAIYPMFGYAKRLATVLGDFAELRNGVVEYMESRGYSLETESEEKMTFRSRSVMNRIFRVWEDRITLEKGLGGFYVEGLSRDITRIVAGLEYKFRNPDVEA